ncbi:MAG: bifunctional fucokinase/L-fucose-1-P-guanylyltransferase [Lachnospiraceae bacterium]|jgi:fucokinase|nr:bifunctional fucokinase/L-fucose-1-P-guanylyltransferase [Lachnospiraceae bacterium]
MNISYNKIKPLFLQQSYLDAWEDYRRALRKRSFPCWDVVVLTASNEDQASAYRKEIEYRLLNALLPAKTRYVVLSDPEGKRVGSGGATLNVLKYLEEKEGGREAFGKKVLVIHSGGDSKRVPQYSVCGKLFSPVPRELPNGRASTLFDEFMIATAGIPARMQSGMLVMSGDVLLLFNVLQIDLQYRGAAAISIKEPISTGKEHGVFLNDGQGMVKRFLHKQSEEQLRALGAVNEQGMVDLDTGAVMLDTELLRALFSLIGDGIKTDPEKFDMFVNDRARISFYGDFLYPLAKDATLEEYYLQAPEGSFCEELKTCRTKIWEVLHKFRMKVICLSPAEFIHFGTTRELLELVTESVEDYKYLHWKRQVCTNRPDERRYAAHNSLIAKGADIGEGCYLEDCDIGEGVSTGEGSILSGLCLKKGRIPPGVVLHGLRLQDGRYTVRIYGVEDNPKGTLEENAAYIYGRLGDMVSYYGIKPEQIWGDQEHYLWFAKLYPVCESMEEALRASLQLVKISENKEPSPAVGGWLSMERCSLYESFAKADVKAVLPWKTRLEDLVLAARFMEILEQGGSYDRALQVFGQVGIDQKKFDLLMEKAKGSGLLLKMRIYYALSRYMRERNIVFAGDVGYDVLERLCFDSLGKAVYDNSRKYIQDNKNFHIVNKNVKVGLPVRVNWGGGWTDTPPYCNENGGVVLNAALKLNGILPIQVEVRRLDALHVEFASEDIGAEGICRTAEEIRDCHNPFDFFALHKAALISCGIVPLAGTETLEEILKRLGGGIYLSTKVVGVPKGSGLGTSSILSGACVKALHEFLGLSCSEGALYDIVLCMEQMMSTGGGWQDQVGGLTNGIKYITTKSGIDQRIQVEQIAVPEDAKKELQERFALIYTGQRRLARNLLREVVGNYIGGRKESVEALAAMKVTAVRMRWALEEGDIDELAELFNEHWELSKQLDMGATNTCIDQIFLSCEDLIDGRFIAGAGGGGFLQAILKKGVTKRQLSERLHEVFQDNGVDVWESEFV